jgi:hypothetical protein
MSATFQYRKKPAVVEAFQWTKEFVEAMEGTKTIICPQWLIHAIGHEIITPSALYPGRNFIRTNTGNAELEYGDWVIHNEETGEVYPCSDADFKAGFDKVEN